MQSVDESLIVIHIKEVNLREGKRARLIELTNIPNNKKWCQKLAKELKKSLGVGGAYKNEFIEIHGEKLQQKFVVC